MNDLKDFLLLALTLGAAGSGWLIARLSGKVDDVVERTAMLEAQHVDTEKVRAIFKEGVDPIMAKLEHQEDVLNEIRVSIASGMRRRKEDFDKDG